MGYGWSLFSGCSNTNTDGSTKQKLEKARNELNIIEDPTKAEKTYLEIAGLVRSGNNIVDMYEADTIYLFMNGLGSSNLRIRDLSLKSVHELSEYGIIVVVCSH